MAVGAADANREPCCDVEPNKGVDGDPNPAEGVPNPVVAGLPNADCPNGFAVTLDENPTKITIVYYYTILIK